MKYYIVYPQTQSANGSDYNVIKVNPVDDANFIEDYGHLVITSGSSLHEALLNFEKWKYEQ